MFQFAQAIGLLGIAGIIVPLIIHLWNVKQGKTLKVGSIAFLTESAKSHAKSYKLSDLLLLLLRCLLLIVLAMVISKPFYEKEINNTKDKGWILIEKDKVHEVYNRFRSKIDSLTRAGYAFHYLATDFEEAQLEAVLKTSRDTVIENKTSYWSLLKELDEKIPSTLPVYIFTDKKLTRFDGSRPEVSLNLKWIVCPSNDTSTTWIQKAFATANDSIRLVIGHSNPTATSYTYQNISPAGSNKQFNLKKADGKMLVAFNDTSELKFQKPVEVDTSTVVISIYTDKYALDATYLKAALIAVKDFSKYKIKVAVVNDVSKIPATSTWLFWLSEETIPPVLMKNSVFAYEKGKVENVHSQLVFSDFSQSSEEIHLSKIIRNNSISTSSTSTIWKDGFNDPVLSVEDLGPSIYHFYSRFNPKWNDLVWSNQFPQMIFDLLLNEETKPNQINDSDKRQIDITQIQPIISAEKNSIAKQSLVDKKDLSKLFWIIAFILLTIERILSSKAKKEEVYG